MTEETMLEAAQRLEDEERVVGRDSHINPPPKARNPRTTQEELDQIKGFFAEDRAKRAAPAEITDTVVTAAEEVHVPVSEYAPKQTPVALSPTEQDVLDQLNAKAGKMDDYIHSAQFAHLQQTDPQTAQSEIQHANQVRQNIQGQVNKLHQMANHNQGQAQEESVLSAIPAWRDNAVRESEGRALSEWYATKGVSVEQLRAHPEKAAQIYSDWKRATTKPKPKPKALRQKKGNIQQAFKVGYGETNELARIKRMLNENGVTSL